MSVYCQFDYTSIVYNIFSIVQSLSSTVYPISSDVHCLFDIVYPQFSIMFLFITFCNINDDFNINISKLGLYSIQYSITCPALEQQINTKIFNLFKAVFCALQIFNILQGCIYTTTLRNNFRFFKI